VFPEQTVRTSQHLILSRTQVLGITRGLPVLPVVSVAGFYCRLLRRPACGKDPQTARRARPLRRRARRIACPAGVAMRARNPWVRLRRTTEGWNVRFMGKSLGEKAFD
jgi:hypothetical protein